MPDLPLVVLILLYIAAAFGVSVLVGIATGYAIWTMDR